MLRFGCRRRAKLLHRPYLDLRLNILKISTILGENLFTIEAQTLPRLIEVFAVHVQYALSEETA